MLCQQNIKINFVFSNFCQISFRFWNTAGLTTDDHIIWRTHFTCWITTAKDTHWQYVILIAFPQQHWLRERASMLRYAYDTRLVNVKLGGRYSNLWGSGAMSPRFPNFSTKWEWVNSFGFRLFYCRKNNTNNYWLGALVRSTVGMGAVERRKISVPSRNRSSLPSSSSV